MRVSFESFWLPKAGNSAEEYEDAFWPPVAHDELEQDTFCCAVADGATESSFSRMWAKLLVEAYCKHSELDEWNAILPEFQSKWRDEVDFLTLPWYAEQKAQNGAFAALLGLHVTGTSGAEESLYKWRALAVGDSCLIQMRENELITSFPISSSEQFSNHPYLICSRPQPGEGLKESIQTESGECQSGDTLYLMTDALACWFLSRREKGSIFDDLRGVTTQARFERLVGLERQEQDFEGHPEMRNDDMTLIRLVVTS